MPRERSYNKLTDGLPAIVAISLIVALGAGILFMTKRGYEHRAEHIKSNMESDSPYLGLGNRRISYEDTDGNGKFETWYKDPVNGQEYRIVIQR